MPERNIELKDPSYGPGFIGAGRVVFNKQGSLTVVFKKPCENDNYAIVTSDPAQITISNQTAEGFTVTVSNEFVGVIGWVIVECTDGDTTA